MGPLNVPLYRFGLHWLPTFLDEVARTAKPEPWGSRMKTLELYLRASYEIAARQSKVHKDPSLGIAFWRAGSLVSLTSDPLWLVYERNWRAQPYWRFREVAVGRPPECVDLGDLTLEYTPPAFHRDWPIHFQQGSLDHMMGSDPSRARLQLVLREALDHSSKHLVLRAIYGEIQLKRKEEAVIAQWYRGDYQFLMPLHLTQPERVELTAVLLPPFCCAAGIGLDFLHGSVTAFEPQVRCFVEAAHPALPDHLNDLVPVAEYVAGLEVIHN